MSFHKNKESGFTIIEVVLVLAIAGLIFLIVFLALPQLQRSRRDTQRRNDVGRVLASLEQFAANNNGQYPDGTTSPSPKTIFSFLEDYFGAPITTAPYEYPELSDPSTGGITITPSYNGVPSQPDDSSIGRINYYRGAFCDGQTVVAAAGSTRQVVVTTILEQGGVYCGDNGGS